MDHRSIVPSVLVGTVILRMFQIASCASDLLSPGFIHNEHKMTILKTITTTKTTTMTKNLVVRSLV